MANHKGSEGLVKIGTATMSELKSWSLDTTQETMDDTVMGDTWRTHQPGLKAWSGSFSCLWDETDTSGQMALDIAGTNAGTATVTLYAEGTGTGATTYSGVVTINSVSRSAAHDGMVEATYQFTGNGTLTKA